MEYISGRGDFKIPAIGLGTYKLVDEVAVNAVSAALEAGYRHIDTASRYGNQIEIGRAIRESDIPREDIFITSKIHWDKLDTKGVHEEIDTTLAELGLDYVDLYLIHWPNSSIPMAETLSAMEEIQRQGKIRYIGVSNFTQHHLEDAQETGIPVMCNQVEFHPTFYQKDLLSYCDEHDIVLTAYGPLGAGRDLKDPVIEEVAKKHKVSPAQVILNWINTKGAVSIPRSDKKEHIRDNIDALSWNLDDEDIQRIDNIKQGERVYKPSIHEFNY